MDNALLKEYVFFNWNEKKSFSKKFKKSNIMPTLSQGSLVCLLYTIFYWQSMHKVRKIVDQENIQKIAF